MKIRIAAKSACLAGGLFLLAACTTSKVLNEWRDTNTTDAKFDHLMVIALFKQDQTRRMFEDEFAWQISNMGQMVTRSYMLAPILNEGITGRIPTITRASGANGILVIRMVNNKQHTENTTDNLPSGPMNLTGFLQYSWKDNYDPPDQKTNAVITVESRFFDVKKDKLVWSLATEFKNQFGLKWEINLLAKQVLGKLKDAMRKK